MLIATDYWKIGRLRRAAHVIMMIGLICLLMPGAAQRAEAVGSKDIQQGNRAYLEWHNTNNSAGIPRQTTIRAYANAGEKIFIGSSAMGLAQGDVRYYGPDGVTTGICTTQGAGVGRINNYAQEQAGTIYDNAAGFTPCVISTAQTITAGPGIWDFEFISPAPGSSIIANDPTPRLATDTAWTQQTTKWVTAAWHVSVRTAANAEITGRVFARYLAYNMGSGGVSLDAEYWIMTNDGYVYKVDTNGLDPYGFIFFANAEGIIDARGNPIYRSMQQVNNALPDPYKIHKPSDLDNIAQGDITYKIFFENPNSDLPETAREYVRSTTPPQISDTWMRRATPASPPIPKNFSFAGIEGTNNQAGTSPLGGYFTFDLTQDANYQITIDVSGEGTYGNLNDRVLLGRASAGSNSVFWDTLDGDGAVIPAGVLNISASIQTNVGEIHFPFVDAENNPDGIQLSRVRGGGTPPEINALAYYNDAYTYVRSSAYNYSPCATGDTPAPPTGSCFGAASLPRTALLGVPSTTGAHAWKGSFGDTRVIDTWTYFPSDSVPLQSEIKLAESKLSITKTHEPKPLIPGRLVTYTVRVTNAGDSPAVNAGVTDSVPAAILTVTWSCAITTGVGVCHDTSGSGNSIDTTVDLDPGAVATYTIQGLLSPLATGSLANTAQVNRPDDNNDPDLSDNVATDDAPIQPVADLELNKVISSPTPIIASSQVTFTIALRNRGPSQAAGVEVSEKLPAGLSFVGAIPSQGDYDDGTGIWNVGDVAPDQVATLTIVTLWDGSAVTNTAQVSKSDTFDPDSSPGNGIASEDDQSSASLPLQSADLRLKKRVSAERVNVGSKVVFTIEVKNHGPDGATGVRVSEQLPEGLELVTATESQGKYDPASGTWTVGSLAVDATASLRIEAKVLGVGPFINTAQISGSDQHDPTSEPNNDDPSEDDQGFAMVEGILIDLSLRKRVDNLQPPYNGVITYTLTLDNDGPSDATGVVVNDKLPAGLVFISATPSGDYNQVSGDWTVGSVAAKTSKTLTIQARVTTGSIVRNNAQVSASDQPDRDSTPGNGDPREDDYASVSLTPQYADLALEKAVLSDNVDVGEQAIFTIAVTNNGPSLASGVVVSERLPAGLDYVRSVASRGAYNPATGDWMIGTINYSETVTLQLWATVTGVGPYQNTAKISKSDQPDNNSSNDQDSRTVSGIMADLSLVKRVNTSVLPADGIVTFTIVVRNDGPSPATGVEVTERLPAGATVLNVSESKGTYDELVTNIWTVGGLAVDESATLELEMRLTGPGPFANVAEITDSDQIDPDSTPDNDNDREDDQAGATVGIGFAPAEADLSLTKTGVALGKLPGSAAFVITVLNRGPDTATNVEVSEHLPAGLQFVSSAPSQGSYDPTAGIWKIGDIPSGASVTLNLFTLITAPPSQSITNSAQVSRSDQVDPNSIPGNGNGNGEDDQDSFTFSRLTAVTLTGLRAERQAKGVLVSWATGVELDSLGFHVYRSETGRRADALRVTPSMILARGGISGASYGFLDASATPGVSYSYWLVEHDSSGATSEFGPVAPVSLSALPNPVYLPLVIR